MITMKISNIEYDTDGEEVDLPTNLNIEVPEGLNAEETDEYISDEISNITGFCHTGFTTEKDLENAYMEKGGNECPHCGGTDISSCGFESDDTYAWREVECENCGKEWKELFSMTGIEL